MSTTLRKKYIRIPLIIMGCLLLLLFLLELSERPGSLLKSFLYENQAETELVVATVALTPGPTPDSTRNKIREVITSVKREEPKVDLILFGEVVLGCFFSDTEDYHKNIAEPIPGKTTQFLADLAKKNNVTISCGLVERLNDSLYNSQVVIDTTGRIMAVQRKKNLRSDYYSSGMEPITILHFKGVQTGVVICYDIQMPETREKARAAETDLILLSLADHTDDWDDKHFGYRYLAKQYNSWLVTANRYGKSCDVEWDGHIEILNPFGDILVKSRNQENFIVYRLKVAGKHSGAKKFCMKIYSKISLGYLVVKNLRIALAYV